MQRCPWCEGSDLYRHYHDTEWGVPMHEDRALFELINLEGAQAGLSWSTVLNKLLWQFVDHKPIQNNRLCLADIPAKTAGSDAMSKALQKIGFKFVGSTICYAFMQASGMVNDYLVTCHRHVTVQ